MRKITILDSYAANPGDLSWKELENLGELTTYERTPATETVERAKDADILINTGRGLLINDQDVANASSMNEVIAPYGMRSLFHME